LAYQLAREGVNLALAAFAAQRVLLAE